MVVGLVSPEEEVRIFWKLLKYYDRLYSSAGVRFSHSEKVLSKEELGDLYFTYPGEEEIATSEEKMQMIIDALPVNYGTPIILLKKKDKCIVIDGHRRVRVAWEKSMHWKALIIIPDKDMPFGIEKMIQGKVKDLFEK